MALKSLQKLGGDFLLCPQGIRNCVTKKLVMIRTIVSRLARGKSLNNTPCFFFLSISSKTIDLDNSFSLNHQWRLLRLEGYTLTIYLYKLIASGLYFSPFLFDLGLIPILPPYKYQYRSSKKGFHDFK